MRTLEVLRQVSVCDCSDGIRDQSNQTVAQIHNASTGRCPLAKPCSAGTLLGPKLRNCIPKMAQDVARYATESGDAIENEIKNFRKAPVFTALGFIDPYDNPDPDATITDRDEICRRVADWATVVLGATNPSSLAEQIKAAHCSTHDEYTEDCRNCGMARLVVEDRADTVYPGGVGKVVPRNQCRCPILRVGDFCPVHGG